MQNMIASSSENILQSNSGTTFATLDARLINLESNVVPSTQAQLSTLTATNAVLMNETFLMLTTIANFNRNRTQYSKLLYDGLENNSGLLLGSSSNCLYDSNAKQVTATASSVLFLQTIDCNQNVLSVVISLGVLSGSFAIFVRRNSASEWKTAAENEWIDLSNQAVGSLLEIKLTSNEPSILNAYSVCWI